ncbi:mariner Mos1 transposase [Trichonephila clavipes]|nr:mariner Mos1 transposase [Trichonephila clavipes]
MALLYIWWDWKGIIYYELLPYGQTLNSDIYCQQLDLLKLLITTETARIGQQKRYCVPTGQRQATHVRSDSPETLVVIWEDLLHPSYSPDLVPSHYCLFLALQNFLSDKKLGSREDCENRLLEIFANKKK